MKNEITKEHLEQFLFAGDCWFALRSKKTGRYFIYNIYRKGTSTVWFLKIRDIRSDIYCGYIRKVGNHYKYTHGKDVPVGKGDLRVVSFMWLLQHLSDTDLTDKISIQHIGKCCKCGKALTDTQSLQLGAGPICAKIIFEDIIKK